MDESVLSSVQLAIDNSNKKELLVLLKDSYKIAIDPETKEPRSLNATSKDITILSEALEKLAFNDLKEEELIKELFRCLNNCCIKNTEAQNEISATTLEKSKELLQSKIDIKAQNQILVFFIGVCQKNQTKSEYCWKLFQNCWPELLEVDGLVKKVTALIYYMLLSSKSIFLEINLFKIVVKLMDQSEFAVFIIEKSLERGLINDYYENLKSKERIAVLEILEELQIQKVCVKLNNNTIKKMISHFNVTSDSILKLAQQLDEKAEKEQLEIIFLAKVLANFTANETFLPLIQKDQNLIINCYYLLKSMHEIGKQSSNCFSPVNKLENISDVDKENPVFGFKANVLRILGNMSWKCLFNQEKIRDLNCIPLILDCCNVDGKNPFIMQWAIYALKNLCENNAENQKIIASLSKKSVVESKVLEECGITLHEDENNSIKLVVKET